MNTQPYPMMTEDFAQPRISPYDPTIQEAKELSARLEEAAQRLAATIPAKRKAAGDLDLAKMVLESAEAELIFLAETDPDSPLKGIAKTSKAYGYAIDAMLSKAAHGALRPHLQALTTAHAAFDQAANDYEQAELLYSALKYKAGLLAAILTASRG